MRAPLGWSAGGGSPPEAEQFWNSCCTFSQQYCEGYHAFQRYESPPSSAVSFRICVYLSPSLCTSLFPLLPPSPRCLTLLPLPHALSRPFLLFLLLSLSRSVSPCCRSLILFLFLSISPFLSLSLSLSLSCCSSAAVLLTLGRQRAGEKSPRPPKDWRERARDETDLGGGKQDNRANTTQIRSRRAAGRGTESQREKLTAPQGLPGRSPTPVLTGPCAA